MGKEDFKKLLLALIFIATSLGIAIDIYVNSIERGIWEGLSIFKYFTLQSNALVMIFAFIELFNLRGLANNRYFRRSLTPVTSYIMLTGITFMIILAPTSTVTGLHKVASDLLHYLVPPLMFFYWIIFEERELKYKYVLSWILYPFFFMFWGLFLAIIKEDYLYPFFDINKFGYGIIPYLLAMTLATAFIGIFLVFVRKRFTGSRIS